MGCRCIQFEMISLTVIQSLIIHVVVMAELLQLTAAAPDAGQALPVMIREKKLKRLSPGSDDLRSIRPDFPSFIYLVYTGSHMASRTLIFHNSLPAGADLIDLFQIA